MSEAVGPMEFQFPADHGHLRTLRKAVRDTLKHLGVLDQRIDQVVLVIDEMVSNAIEHGRLYRTEGHLLHVTLRLEGRNLLVEFLDPGAPVEVVRELIELLAACRGNRPPLHSERGRGLFLIDDGLDELSVEPAPGGGLSMRGSVREVVG